jgi:hypothetical protein
MKMTPGLQFKFAGGAGNAVEGYAARFGERDLGGDTIEAGAFSKTILEIQASGHRIPMLLAHAQEDVIGSWLELREDAAGLYAVGGINAEVQRGREALSLVKGGDLSGLSIGYQVPAGGRDGGSLTEIKLLEISIVAVPMAPKARIALKDFDGLEDYAAFLRSAGVSRREAEFVARKSWPAIQAADQAHDLSPLTRALEEGRLALAKRIKR